MMVHHSVKKIVFVLLSFLLCACHASRPANIEESTTTSMLHRVLAGVWMGVSALCDLIMPQPPVNRTPTKIKVQFVGMGRTGTTSLASAMSILGYKTLHDDEGAEVLDLYGDYYEGLLTEDELYAKIGERGFNCSFMYNAYRWAAKQEDVKVILTKRDPEKWADSWLVVADFIDIMGKPPFSWFPLLQRARPLHIEMFKDIPTGGIPEKYLDRDTLIRGYEVHAENVRRLVPEERLLEYSVKEGWEPLCQFLGLDVPGVPFPHINDRVKIRAVMTVFRVLPYIWPLFVILPLLLVYRLFSCCLGRTGKKKAKGE